MVVRAYRWREPPAYFLYLPVQLEQLERHSMLVLVLVLVPSRELRSSRPRATVAAPVQASPLLGRGGARRAHLGHRSALPSILTPAGLFPSRTSGLRATHRRRPRHAKAAFLGRGTSPPFHPRRRLALQRSWRSAMRHQASLQCFST